MVISVPPSGSVQAQTICVEAIPGQQNNPDTATSAFYYFQSNECFADTYVGK